MLLKVVIFTDIKIQTNNNIEFILHLPMQQLA